VKGSHPFCPLSQTCIPTTSILRAVFSVFLRRPSARNVARSSKPTSCHLILILPRSMPFDVLRMLLTTTAVPFKVRDIVFISMSTSRIWGIGPTDVFIVKVEFLHFSDRIQDLYSHMRKPRRKDEVRYCPAICYDIKANPY